MVAVILNDHHLEGSIEKGLALMKKGNLAFKNIGEAERYANHHYGHGNYVVHPLCGECEEGSYKPEPSMKYPSTHRLLKEVKIMPND